MPDVVVVGGGHNGLVAACYLSRAGRDVLLAEQSGRLGGGSRTEELLPGCPRLGHPGQLGTALFAVWQAFYHQVGQWHAIGGSVLVDDASDPVASPDPGASRLPRPEAA